jgi:hypothetical protein
MSGGIMDGSCGAVRCGLDFVIKTVSVGWDVYGKGGTGMVDGV